MKRTLDIAAVVLAGAAAARICGCCRCAGSSSRKRPRRQFGSPVSDDAGGLFSASICRAISCIAVAGAILLLTRQWMPLAILLTVAAALPVFDMTVLSLERRHTAGLSPVALALIAHHRGAAVAAASP